MQHAADKMSLQGDRAKALHSLCVLLRSSEGFAAAVPLAPLFWSPVLVLLSDAAPAVRQHAAPALGLLGAAATRNTSGGPAKGVQHAPGTQALLRASAQFRLP